MVLNELSESLFRTRRLIELLVFKLAEEKLVAAAGRSEWLVHAVREVDSVASELQVVELERALLVPTVAEALGLDGAPRLAALCAAAPSPWGRILEEHRGALIDLLEEAHDVARSGRGVQPEVLVPASLLAGAEGSPGDSTGGRAAATVASPAETAGPIDAIVEELRAIDAASGESGREHRAAVSSRRGRDLDCELADAVAAVQMHEVAIAHSQPSPIKVIQASLVEFLR